MNAGWAFCGFCCLVSAAMVNPLAGIFGALGAAILLLARIEHSMGKIVRLSMAVVHAYIYDGDDLIEKIQALSAAMIRWRKI